MSMRTTQRQVEQADQAGAPPPKSEGKASSQQAAPAEGQSKRSQHPVISTRSQRPPTEGNKEASEVPKSHASAVPKSNAAASGVVGSQRSLKSQVIPAVGASKQGSMAASKASNAAKSNQQSVGSRREIRTGGFSKLGEEIMQN